MRWKNGRNYLIPIDGRRNQPSNGIVGISIIGAWIDMPLLNFTAVLELKHIVYATLNVWLSEIAFLSPG